MRALAITLTAILSLSGCSSKPIDPEAYPGVVRAFSDPETAVALDVPFIEQDAYTCGPAALTACLLYLGIDADHDTVADQMDGWDGADDFDMDRVARMYGCKALFGPGTDRALHLAAVRQAIRDGFPVIVHVRHDTLTPWVYRNHYMLVVGFTPKCLIFHNGADPFAPLTIDEYWEMHARHPSPGMFTIRKLSE